MNPSLGCVFVIIIKVLFLAVPLVLHAQERNDSFLASCISKNKFNKLEEDACKGNIDYAKKLYSLGSASAEIDVEYRKQYFANLSEQLKINTKIIEQQIYLNVVIFVSVLLVVFFGIYFCYLQIKNSDKSQSSSFELSKDGLKVRSPFIGLMILLISVVFFYLYLTKVFAIQLLAETSGKTQSASSSTENSGNEEPN